MPVSRPGERPEDEEPPEFAAMAAALERNGVRIVAAPEPSAAVAGTAASRGAGTATW